MNNNKLIAEFMKLPTEVFNSGLLNYYHREYNSGTWYEEHELSYNVSWDWLMPVANEIIKSRDEQNADWDLTDFKYGLQSTNIDMLYKAVIEFIKTHEDNQIIDNGLIAEFMGYEVHPVYEDERHDLQYHTSWDWLMPVVEKIESLGYKFEKNLQRIDRDWQCLIIKGNDILYQEFNTDSRIACHYVVVEFIKTYNKTKL